MKFSLYILLGFYLLSGCRSATPVIVSAKKTLVIRVNTISAFLDGINTMNETSDKNVDLVLASGTYEDVVIAINITNKSIYQKRILGEGKSKVVLSGQLYFGVRGNNISIDNFSFIRTKAYGDATPIVAFKDSRNSVVRNTSFQESKKYFKRIPWKFAYYVTFVRGFSNKIINCEFNEKYSEGSIITLHSISREGANGNHHIIDDNYFGPRPYTNRPADTAMRLGSTGGAADVESAHVDLGIIVSNNFFDEYSAYYEIISVKSAGNFFINNTFLNCNGYLSLRNAADCRVEGNRFVGNGKLGTRGVRIQGPGHQIVNNYFQGLSGSAIWVWGGNGKLETEPSELKMMPTYINTESILIEKNTIVDCDIPIEFLFIDKVKNFELPRDILLKENLILGSNQNGQVFSIRAEGFIPSLSKLQEGIRTIDNVVKLAKQDTSDIIPFDRNELVSYKKKKLKFSSRKNYYYYKAKKKVGFVPD